MELIAIYDGNKALVRFVDYQQANELLEMRMAVPFGRRKLKGIELTVGLEIAMLVIRGIRYPLGQGSRTFRRIWVAGHPLYEHHRERCLNWHRRN